MINAHKDEKDKVIDERLLISLYKEASFLSNKIETLKKELKPLELSYEAIQSKIKQQFETNIDE